MTSTAQVAGDTERASAFDVDRIRRDFPILAQTVHGKRLAYLDNAATAQKPQSVLDVMERYYREDNANIHRGVHLLSERATAAYEAARAKVQHFINARHSREIIFTRSSTESINLVAQTFGRQRIGHGDEVVISAMEHHSNIVPWQMICEEKGARLRVVPITDAGELRLGEYERLLGPRTKLVAITHMSNALGTVTPARQIVEIAHQRGAPVLFDGSQAAYHMTIDVQALDCDFYAITGHKLYGPTGIGVLYGKSEHLESMPPYQGGGDMISAVTFEKTTYNTPPYKFEAGTPNICGVIGLGAAVDYITAVGLDEVAAHERELLRYGTDALHEVRGLRIIGTSPHKASILSFVMKDIHPHDIGTILDQEGVAIRTGHHCAMPVMERFGIPATARASLAMYNTREDIDALVSALRRVEEVFG
ncbi:MAG: cysteine desulfurase [Acidobacteria bacterium]|nr:cysteine desulfurase [Acidobacteriota bacterium]